LVIDTVRQSRATPPVVSVALSDAAGRVLAEDVAADRHYPAVARSVRDGFAVRAADLPGTLFVVGEIRAGERFEGSISPGQAVEIMTGAPVPNGADCVVMVEHCKVTGDHVTTDRTHESGDHIDAAGCMARAGDIVLQRGRRLGFPDIAMLATAGKMQVPVFACPRVAIVATGDELVEAHEQPAAYQIRNSNVHSLAAQVARAGGLPEILPIARDLVDVTRDLIRSGLERDLLLLSGGVSAGKYDVVETALETLGAEFLIDRVLIQPGQPLVFGRCGERCFFGLPGNPASTMVCFEIFARAAVELLGGQEETVLPLLEAVLDDGFHIKPGLTRFLPAHLAKDGQTISRIQWQGSGDIPALARANCFLVTDPDRSEYQKGERIRVLLQ